MDEVLNFIKYPVLIKTGKRKRSSLMRKPLPQIYTILKKVSGIDFTNYKRTTVLRRIERRMVVTHSTSIPKYVALLSSNAEEGKILVKEILIGVTNFFRDPSYLKN